MLEISDDKVWSMEMLFRETHTRPRMNCGRLKISRVLRRVVDRWPNGMLMQPASRSKLLE